MKNSRQLLAVGSLIVLFAFLVTILLLLQSNSAIAAEVDQLVAAAAAKEEIRKGKGESQEETKQKEEVQRCIRGRGCMAQEAQGEQSVNGGACTSGMACSAEGAVCGRSGKTCKTWDMGGGNCGCVCN